MCRDKWEKISKKTYQEWGSRCCTKTQRGRIWPHVVRHPVRALPRSEPAGSAGWRACRSVKSGHFDCTGPRRESGRKKRGLIIPSEFFLCLIFPSWQGRFKLRIQKKFVLSRTVLVLVITHAAGPTISCFFATRNGSLGTTEERAHLSPQCINSKGPLGRVSVNSHFTLGGEEVKEGMTYPGLSTWQTRGRALHRQSWNES